MHHTENKYYEMHNKQDVQKGKAIMKTVLFAYNQNSERYNEALLKDIAQSLAFMCSYKVRIRRRNCV